MLRFLPHLLLFFFITTSLYPQGGIVQSIINQVNIDSLTKYVKELSGVQPTIINGTSQTIASRHKNYPGNDLAHYYIKQKLESYGLPVTVQVFSTTGKNVYAVQTGYRHPNKKYMICGHYDSMPNGPVSPGADDNASGTAAVIEAARILSNYSFPYTIIYALWDEEEQGLVGSAYYAQQASTAGDSILGVINLDMIAWDSNNDGKAEIHTRNIAQSLLLSNKMTELNQSMNIGLNPVTINPGLTASDHASFWNRTYSAILLIEDYNSDFNSYYHTTNDLINYFNNAYFLKMTKLALATFVNFTLDLNMQIVHTPLQSTNSTAQINTSAIVQTGMTIATGVGTPVLYYRTKTTGNFSNFTMVTGSEQKDGSYSFTIPGQELGTLVQYYIAAQDSGATICATSPSGGNGFNPPGAIPPQSFHQFYVAEQTIVFYDEANSTNGWTADGTWGITTTKYVSPPSSFTDSPSGNYANYLTMYFTYSGTINLTNAMGAMLQFNAQWNIEDNYDYAQIQVSTNNGSTWTPLKGLYTNPGTGSFQPNGEPLYDGTQSTWVNELIDLYTYVGKQINLRFLLRSDNVITADGIYIDNIKITTYNYIPVELISFNAEVNKGSVILNWSTASETNNKEFQIERKSISNNGEWKLIGTVKGAGTTSSLSSYQLIDDSPLSDIVYYRLKQFDFDGTINSYKEIEVDTRNIYSFSLEQNYPNPFNPSTTIKFSIPSGVETHHNVSLRVYDVLGKEVATLINNEWMEAGIHNHKFSLDNYKLASGVYFYQLQAGNFIDTKKFIILK